jgi:sulfatase modifying factor 1
VRVRALALLALGALGALGCDETAQPRSQWVLHVGTDAIVPQIGDRLLVEILDERGEVCSACRRQFGVSEDGWPLSVGIVPGGGETFVRVRLYRTQITGDDGFPATDRHLDALARLPDAVGITNVGLDLGMACFGRLADPVAGTTCDPTTGQPGAVPTLEADDSAAERRAEPGSWVDAGPTGCEGAAAPTGMACVPGGMFLMGSPRFLPLDASDLVPVPEQVVVLSPFFLDVDEVTVAAIRPLVEAGALPAPTGGAGSYCTWGRGDALPANCVTWDQAAEACAAFGKRLPTEAEWEYAASNLQLETPFPWLDASLPACDQAVIDQTVLGDGESFAGSCLPSGVAEGPITGGHPGDVTLLGIRNLAGNVTEWVADGVIAYTDARCWGPDPAVRRDPRCEESVVLGARAIRGGSFGSVPVTMTAYFRRQEVGRYETVGFRCAQSL